MGDAEARGDENRSQDPGGDDAEVPHSCSHRNRRRRRLRGGSDRSRHRPQHGRPVHLALARVIDSGRAKRYDLSSAWKLSASSALRRSTNVTSATRHWGCRSRAAIRARSVRAARSRAAHASSDAPLSTHGERRLIAQRSLKLTDDRGVSESHPAPRCFARAPRCVRNCPQTRQRPPDR